MPACQCRRRGGQGEENNHRPLKSLWVRQKFIRCNLLGTHRGAEMEKKAVGTEWVLERFAPLWQWGCRPRPLKSVVQAEVQQIQPFLEEKGRLSARVGKGWGTQKGGEESSQADVQHVQPFWD